MRWCLTLLVTREMQMKTKANTTTYPLEWLLLKRLTIASIGKDVQLLECSYIVNKNTKMLQPLCHLAVS